MVCIIAMYEEVRPTKHVIPWHGLKPHSDGRDMVDRRPYPISAVGYWTQTLFLIVFGIPVAWASGIATALFVTSARCGVVPIENSTIRIEPPVESRGVHPTKRVVVAVGVPVAACLRRVAAQEPPQAGVVVPVVQRHQPRGGIRLVAAGARKLPGVAVLPLRVNVSPNAS